MNIEQFQEYSWSLSTKIKSEFLEQFNETEEKFYELVTAIYQDIDDEINRMKQIDNPSVACKRGCSYCCSFRVAVSIAEAIAIAWYIKKYFTLEDLEFLKSLLVTLVPQTAQMTVEQLIKSKYTCPFLVSNQCRIYLIRPLSCRGWNSTNVNLCEISLTDENVFHRLLNHQYIMQQQISVIALDAINDSIDLLGLYGDRVELITALKTLLFNEHAVENWLRGEDVFAEAKQVLLNDYYDGDDLSLYQISKRKNIQ